MSLAFRVIKLGLLRPQNSLGAADGGWPGERHVIRGTALLLAKHWDLGLGQQQEAEYETIRRLMGE